MFKCEMAPLPSPKIAKWLNKSIHFEGVLGREFLKKKDRMRLHELSYLFKKKSQSVLSTKIKKEAKRSEIGRAHV